MQRVIPHLWFDKKAAEPAAFYTSIFDDSEVENIDVISDTPSGDVELVSFRLLGQRFQAISAGPMFTLNPSISFMVFCKSTEDVNRLWSALEAGGKALMELGEYPFSKRYGWLEDKYGLSWQLIFVEDEELEHSIVPTLMFVGDVCGRCEEAIGFYTSIFSNSKMLEIHRYGQNEGPDKAESIKHAEFTLDSQTFAAMDSAYDHAFAFGEALSFIVRCANQAEIDFYWDALSAVPDAERCGWLKDQFGVSWQILPANMDELMAKNPEKTTPAMLAMKKIIIADLEAAGAPDN